MTAWTVRVEFLLFTGRVHVWAAMPARSAHTGWAKKPGPQTHDHNFVKS